MKKYFQPLLIFLIFSVGFLNACKPTQEITGEPTPTEETTAIPSVVKVTVPPYIPDALKNILVDMQSVVLTASLDEVGVRLDVSSEEP
ncbi:MAG: hypothetical protein Q7J07_09235, partial [Pelolinea sp.]|nr:hypothetical protein [Pelolinea sp.]